MTRARMALRCALVESRYQSWWMSRTRCRRRKDRIRDLCLCLKHSLNQQSAVIRFNGPSAPTTWGTEIRETSIINGNHRPPVASVPSFDRHSAKVFRLPSAPADQLRLHHPWSSPLRLPVLLSHLSFHPNVRPELLMFVPPLQRTSPTTLPIKVDSKDDCSVR
jgi:hypothetical protein